MNIISEVINGKEYKFRFSMKCLARWQRAEGLTMSDMNGDMDFMHLGNLFRFASEEGGQPLTLDEVFELMEQPGAFAKLTAVMNEQMAEVISDDEGKETP